jgi:hypothetical protein
MAATVAANQLNQRHWAFASFVEERRPTNLPDVWHMSDAVSR